MTELTFYRQKRNDGGVRTGIELDGEQTLLSNFSEGPVELQDQPLNSALLWYVDLRCRGERLPTESESSRAWFLAHAEGIREGLAGLVEAIGLGTDDAEPIRWTTFPGFPPGVRVEAVCSAIRRVRSEELVAIILDLARQFVDLVTALSVPEPVAL